MMPLEHSMIWGGHVCMHAEHCQCWQIPQNVPEQQELVLVQVTGPVKFAAGVSLKGKVAFTNTSSEPATLMAGEYADVEVDVKVPTAVPA